MIFFQFENKYKNNMQLEIKGCIMIRVKEEASLNLHGISMFLSTGQRFSSRMVLEVRSW